MIRMKKVTTLLMLCMVGGVVNTFAQMQQPQAQQAQPQQEVISNDDLEKFVSAAQEVEAINQSSQQEMANVVVKEDLTIQRYNEIQQAAQNPNQETDASQTELQKCQTASLEIEKIQMKAQQKMQEKIVEKGLTVNRYQEIATAVQTNPELQKKLQTLMQQG